MNRKITVTSAATLALTGAGATAQDCAWEAFSVPMAANGFQLLYDVDGVSADNVWAVGRYSDPDFFNGHYVVHFDGTEWTHTPVPNPSQTRGWNNLFGVVALGADDAIAVGGYNPDSGGSAGQSLAMRWDGSDWSLIDSPWIEGGSGYFGVDQVDGTVWAVGYRRSGEDPPAVGVIALATRWTGSGWEAFPVERLAQFGGRGYNELFAIDGASADDIWGVGQARQIDNNDPFGPRTYMVHWDGSEWSLVDQEFGNRFFSSFEDVVALAPDDVWAVGWTLDGNDSTEPLLVHFDGSGWSEYDLPNFPEGPAELRAVAARSSDEVYAFGTWADANNSPRDLILRYDGAEWTQIDSAPINGDDVWFRGAATLPNNDVWAVGQFFDNTRGRTIAHSERLDCSFGGGCAADFNGDGEANTLDVLAFLNAWSAGDGSADFNGDGAINTLDVLAFLNTWSAGC